MYRIEKSKDMMLVIRLKFGDLRCSYNSFEFFRMHIRIKSEYLEKITIL